MANNTELFFVDGKFYAGHQLKNGKMAKGAYCITDEDIVSMFVAFFKKQVKNPSDTRMEMKDADGNTFITFMLSENTEKG